jgi:hypothetical protein
MEYCNDLRSDAANIGVLAGFCSLVYRLAELLVVHAIALGCLYTF